MAKKKITSFTEKISKERAEKELFNDIIKVTKKEKIQWCTELLLDELNVSFDLFETMDGKSYSEDGTAKKDFLKPHIENYVKIHLRSGSKDQNKKNQAYNNLSTSLKKAFELEKKTANSLMLDIREFIYEFKQYPYPLAKKTDDAIGPATPVSSHIRS